MRGWVGVSRKTPQKMAEVPEVQGLNGILVDSISALLAWLRFQPFVSESTNISHAIMALSALMNLENSILD